MFDSLDAAVWAAGPEGIVAYANTHLHALLGYENGTLLGQAFAVFNGSEPPASAGRRDLTYRRRDGGRVAVIEATSAVVVPGGQFLTLRVASDVSRHRESDRTEPARPSTKGVKDGQLRAILEQSPIGVSVSRRDSGEIIFANTRFAELVGLPRDEIVGAPARSFYVDEQQRARVVERLKAAGSVTNMEVQFRRVDGSSFWTLFTINQAMIEGAQVNLAWIYDYTERRNIEEALRDMASKDPLTGVHNRRSFMELTQQQLGRAGRFGEAMAVLVLDIDHFKRVNDLHGHATGDEALRLTAAACLSVLRDYDILGRLGGEEFAIALPGATPEVAHTVAERVRQRLAGMPVPLEDYSFHLTVSIGVASVEGPADALEKVIHRADLALYRAKRDGRNRVVVYQPGL